MGFGMKADTVGIGIPTSIISSEFRYRTFGFTIGISLHSGTGHSGSL
jgi:hypothetical protein